MEVKRSIRTEAFTKGVTYADFRRVIKQKGLSREDLLRLFGAELEDTHGSMFLVNDSVESFFDRILTGGLFKVVEKHRTFFDRSDTVIPYRCMITWYLTEVTRYSELGIPIRKRRW